MITKAEIRTAIMELLRRDRVVSSLAGTLALYARRGEFDGTLRSAIGCLRQARYEVRSR